MLNQYLESIDYSTLNDFRLPTESEWEFAARGGIASQSYPWGGIIIWQLQKSQNRDNLPALPPSKVNCF